MQARTVPSIRDLGGSPTDTVKGEAVRLDTVGKERLDLLGPAQTDGLKPSEFQFDYLPGGPEGTYTPPKPETFYDKLSSRQAIFLEKMQHRQKFLQKLENYKMQPLKV